MKHSTVNNLSTFSSSANNNKLNTEKILNSKSAKVLTWDFTQKEKDEYSYYSNKFRSYYEKTFFQGGDTVGSNVTRDLNSSINLFRKYYHCEFTEKELFNILGSVIDPLGRGDEGNLNNKSYKRIAKVRKYNVIKPLINTLLGIYSERDLIYTIVVINEDANEYQKKFIIYELTKHLESLISDIVTKHDQKSQEEVISIIDSYLEDLKDNLYSSYVDIRAKAGIKILRHIEHNNKVKFILRKIFKSFLIDGTAYTLKTNIYDNLLYKDISSKDAYFEIDSDKDFVEDANWAMYRNRKTIESIITDYRYDLSKEDVNKLENFIITNDTGADLNSIGEITDIGTDSDVDYNSISSTSDNSSSNLYDIRVRNSSVVKPVYVLYYREKIKSYEVIFEKEIRDEEGNVESIEISEEIISQEEYPIFKKQYNILNTSVLYLEEIREIVYIPIIDKYINKGKILNDRYDTKDDKGKLPINGLDYSESITLTSLVSECIPYQEQIFLYAYKLEQAIGKLKDSIAVLDSSILEENDPETVLYFMNELGFLFANSDKVGNDVRARNKFQEVLSFGSDTIKLYLDLISFTMDFMKMNIGINDDLMGNIPERKGKAVTERSISQGFKTLQSTFDLFEEFENRELMGLLQIGKILEVSSGRYKYLLSDQERMIYQLDDITMISSEFDIFTSNSIKELNNLNYIKELAFNFSQNGSTPRDLVDLIESKSLSELKSKLDSADRKKQQMDARVQEFNQIRQERLDSVEDMKLEILKYKESINEEEVEEVKRHNLAIEEIEKLKISNPHDHN